MNQEEKKRLFQEILEKLKESFPPNTVEFKEVRAAAKGSGVYIPVQPYIHRLNEVAGQHWSWTDGRTEIFHEDDLVQYTGILRILDSEREGIGFSKIQRYGDSGKAANLKEAIKSARSDALRDAADLFEMGWRDLAPYRKWASNPGTGLDDYVKKATDNRTSIKDEPFCMKCRMPLTDRDLELKKKYRLQYNYCEKDIPPHLIK
ncbi:Rad52/Rad22 family DNA repair protein [Aneurinibacillus migulanus]|uniref:Rad52/Rad22 family DNA repair protein n=1 Tax=Aneurinibacillus migulanus TaxID=47500 RepID=UPI002E1AE0B8|nr:Rad52/Rad22 family DNA repair protein [Aneurinibacillus migulanus]